MAQGTHGAVGVQQLPDSFRVEELLQEQDKDMEGVTFYGKVLGQQNGYVLCETDDGVYYFRSSDVLRCKAVHECLDMLVLKQDGSYQLVSTIKRLTRHADALTEDLQLTSAAGRPRGTFHNASTSPRYGLRGSQPPKVVALHEYRDVCVP